MRDICLRADTEADLKDALAWALDADGEWMPYGDGYGLDLIGPVQTADAIMGEPDPETGEQLVTTPATFDARFHANLRITGDLDPAIPESVIVYPTQQRRVFS